MAAVSRKGSFFQDVYGFGAERLDDFCGMIWFDAVGLQHEHGAPCILVGAPGLRHPGGFGRADARDFPQPFRLMFEHIQQGCVKVGEEFSRHSGADPFDEPGGEKFADTPLVVRRVSLSRRRP